MIFLIDIVMAIGLTFIILCIADYMLALDKLEKYYERLDDAILNPVILGVLSFYVIKGISLLFEPNIGAIFSIMGYVIGGLTMVMLILAAVILTIGFIVEKTRNYFLEK